MIKKGSFVVCDHCLEPLYKFVRDVQFGEICSMDQIESIHPQPAPKDDGTPMICYKCKFPVSGRMLS